MAYQQNPHSFHIPVMGLAFTIDTPIKVAHFGISSVLSIGDDILIERVRKFYAQKFKLPFSPIPASAVDARAHRVTAYLDMVNSIVQQKFEVHKKKLASNLTYMNEYLDLLPNYASVKNEFLKIWDKYSPGELKEWLNAHLCPGSIDVNIMTKLDKANQHKGETLPQEYNDAHASLRGYAKSKLASSIVLSAGLNPRLFSYMENFDDFFPDEEGQIKKKITIKVSDYRSALIQGKFLAKKGLWVSEYRIESGLNCGGHAFATQGKLMGPILEEFKKQRQALHQQVFELFKAALREKGRFCPDSMPDLKITAQGGVGTAEEHRFLLDHYHLSSVGWGSPFLLVPEAVSIDGATRKQLSEAKEKDIYLSDASPLGVPFNNLRGSSRQIAMEKKVLKGKSGSPCTKKYLKLNTEFTEKPICTASSKYHKLKLEQLNNARLGQKEYEKAYAQLMEKECLCGGLSTPFFMENSLDTKVEGPGASVCPGPNLAYFSGKFTLREMVGHIYGKHNIISRNDRPHMFIKELRLYMDYYKKQLDEFVIAPSDKLLQNLKGFQEGLMEGIAYYRALFENEIKNTKEQYLALVNEFDSTERELGQLALSLKMTC